MAAGATAPASPERNDYARDEAWLCKPDRKDLCAIDLAATVVAADGTLTRESWAANPQAPIDCFYVYPTVSTDPTPNSDMQAGPEEARVIAAQAARFGSQCRVYAPLYRQVTLTALRSAMAGQAFRADGALGYGDVAQAWRHYLENDNRGRGVVLIGHSQGAGMLTQLIRNEIDGKPVQARIVSALLIGSGVAVPAGKDVGGAFKSMPLCRSEKQTGCVISYASFRDTVPPPAGSRFGRVQGDGLVAACTNPAALGGSGGALDAYFGSALRTGQGETAGAFAWTTPAKPIDTPWVRLPGLLSSECVEKDGRAYLSVKVQKDPADPRADDIPGDVMANGQVQADWGLHLIDMNLAMGNLLRIVGEQGRAWLGTAAQENLPPVGAALPDVAMAAPDSQGFSGDGLRALSAELRGLVDAQKLAGVSILAARRGKVVHFDVYGKANVETGQPLAPDSIFRIASMTKPITGVAMMQLYERGKWKLDDPVAKHIPEFAALEVKKAGGGTEPQKSPMTMAQLMSHSAGFGASAVYRDLNLDETDLQGMIDKLKTLPLETQPGSAWDYGPSVNIQGYIVEKLSGMSLDAYFAQNIFEPLGMTDTGFWVPAEKAGRVVAVHAYDADGKIRVQPDGTVKTTRPRFLAGSGGLMSTARDYWRFAQSLASGGALDGKRILEKKTVELMRKNVLGKGIKVDLYGPSQEGIGFGMDFAVVLDPKAAGTPHGRNSFYWGGAFGTWFWIDPTNDLVFVGMIQNANGSRPDAGTPRVREMSSAGVYRALTNPSR